MSAFRNNEPSRRTLLQGALAAGVSAVAGACHKHVVLDPRGWHDARGTQYVVPSWQWAPRSARELVEAVGRAEREGHRIRMTGSGHSFSDVAMNADWLLAPTGLSAFPPLDTTTLRAGTDASRLFRVAAGTTIHTLNNELARRGLALQNMGGADFQTIVGATSTATHGSGLAFGPLSSQIASIQVVGPKATLMQVEPANGITDPARFSAGRAADVGVLPEDRGQQIELKQDDDLFNSLAVGLGCLGVIYAVVLRVVPRYWIVERRTVTTWEDLIAPTGALTRLLSHPRVDDRHEGAPITAPRVPDDRAPDHFEVFYTPYRDASQRHMALLTERWRTESQPPNVGGTRGSLLFTIGEDLTHLADEHGLLQVIFDRATLSQVLAFHEDGLRGMAQPYYANVSYQVFNVGIVNDINAYGIELSLPIEQMALAVERTFQIAEWLSKSYIFHTAPISLRFVAPSSAHLAMQNRPGPTVTLEIGVLNGLLGAEELLQTYEHTMIAELSARPHWGLSRDALHGTSQVARLYPDWSKWMQSFALMNPCGTFDGLVTDRLGISHMSG